MYHGAFLSETSSVPLKCLQEGEQQKCTNGGKTTECILLPLQMLSNFIQIITAFVPVPDKFPSIFPCFQTKLRKSNEFCAVFPAR